MNLEDLPAPAPGSFAAHLLLDRQAGDIETELERLFAADPPVEIYTVLRGWWGSEHRFLLVTEAEEWTSGRLIDDGTELLEAVLETLFDSAASKWSIHAAPAVQARIQALLLDCSQPTGGVQ